MDAMPVADTARSGTYAFRAEMLVVVKRVVGDGAERVRVPGWACDQSGAPGRQLNAPAGT